VHPPCRAKPRPDRRGRWSLGPRRHSPRGGWSRRSTVPAHDEHGAETRAGVLMTHLTIRGARRRLYSFVPAEHALSGFLEERQGVLDAALDRLGPDWRCDGADLKLGEAPRWTPARLVCHLTDGSQQAIHICPRKEAVRRARCIAFPTIPTCRDSWRGHRTSGDAQGRPLAEVKLLRHVPTRRVTLSARTGAESAGRRSSSSSSVRASPTIRLRCSNG
jgi:hypothetical protein